MAAGMSSRFAPLSYEIPKGLLQVKGERLIERQIRQLQEAGIEDITVTVATNKKKCSILQRSWYKNCSNNDYYKYNNCSSLMLVKNQLSNTYILFIR